ncbi:MAG TPA: glycosyltransferase [Treponemataceae bacterium]|mgnify:CR=1 FL=1|nr:glycosyltransferase [Treponemataceae bacterium]
MSVVNSPAVSVVLCTNRKSPFLAEAVRSILGQTFRDLELIIVINGVGEGEMNEIKSSIGASDRRMRVEYTPMKGLPFSLNYGIHLARGKYVARMDDDDVSREGRIAAQFEYLEGHPEITVCGTWYELLDDEGTTRGLVAGKASDKSIRKILRYRNPLCHPSVMMRRDALLGVGGYGAAVHCEDYELWVRLSAMKGVRFSVLPVALLGYRMDAIGSARSSRQAYSHMCGIQFRMFLDTNDPRWLFGCLITHAKMIIKAAARGLKKL